MIFRIDLKIFIFLIILYFTRQIKIYWLIMLFAFLHEFGHLMAGIILKMKVKKISIMPTGFSIEFALTDNDYNKKILNSNILEIKKIIIAFAGPLVNLIIMSVFIILHKNEEIAYNIIYSNFLIAIFNLLPIYPLDGGRILSGILHIIVGKQKADDAINNISMISTILITAIASVLILYLKNIAIFLIVMYLWYLVLKESNRYLRRKKYIMKILENKTNK